MAKQDEFPWTESRAFPSTPLFADDWSLFYFIQTRSQRSPPQLYLVPGAVQRPSCHEKEPQTENITEHWAASQPAINPGLLYRAS